MSDTEQDLRVQLLQVQQELAAARLRITELEAHSSNNQPQFALELLRITHEASDFEAAIEATLRLICKYSGWVYGEIWLPNPDRTRLVYGPVHYVEPSTSQHLSAFQTASEICTFAPGEGLIGRVWASNAPEWIADLFQLTEAEFKRRELGVEVSLHGMVAVPVGTSSQVDAVLCFGTYETLAKDDTMVYLIATAAQQIGMALRSKRTEAALKRYAQRMEILHEIDLGLIQGSSIQALVEVTLKHLRQLVPCQRTDVSIMDETTGEALVFAVGLDGDTTLGPGVRVPIPPDVFEGYDARHIRVFDDIRLFQESRPRARRLVNEGLLCALSVMLMDRERPIGVLGLFADKPGFFTAEHQEIVGEVASQLAIAIRQLRLSEALAQHATDLEQNNASLKQAEASLQRYAQRMEILHQIDLGLIQGGSIQTLVEATLKHLRELIPCQRANLAILDPTTGDVLIFAVDLNGETALGQGLRVPFLPGVFEGLDARNIRVFEDFRPLQESYPQVKQVVKEGMVSGLQAVLMDQERPIGSLSLLADTPGFFTSEHQDIAAEIASQLAIAIRQLNLSEELARHALELEQKVAKRTADLSDAKDRVEAILNNSIDGIFLIHTDLNIQQVNSSFNTLFASEQDDYFGKSLASVVYAEDVDLVTKTVQAVVAEKEGKTIEIRTVRKDGTVFDADLSIGYIQNDGLVCTIRDISERKQQERQLRYLASLQENVSEAVISTDMEFRIQAWNRAAESIYGWRAEEVIGRTAVEVLQTRYESVQEREQARREFLKHGHGYGEFIQHRKDGSEVHILGSTTLFKDEQGVPFGIVSVNHDISEHKQAEEALRESEEKFRLLMDAAPVAIVITNRAGQIVLINNQAETLFGYNRAELLGQPVEVLVPDYAREGHADFQVAYLEAPRLRQMGSGLDLFARHKDGSEIPVEIQLSYIETQTGLLVTSFVVDITERKRNAAALEQQQAFLRNVIDFSPSTIFVKDYDARFVLANRLAAQLYNTTVDAIIGKSDADFNPSSEEAQAFLEADRRVISTGEPLFLEEPITNFSGETRWLQTTKVPIVGVDGESKYVLGVSTDITERKNAEEALREQHEFLQQVINSLPELITVKDRAGRYQLVNRREAEVHGSTPDAMLGKTNADFNPNQAEIDFFVQKDRETLETGQITFIPEETVMGRYYQTTKIPLKNKDGEFDRLLIVASDITERKNAEEALHQAFEKEKELGELKSRFVSMASHEFRTPLATILATTETLSAYRQKMTEAQIDARLGKIREQVDHLKDIMEDVLQLARLQARRVEFNAVKLDLDAMCRSVLDEFQSRPEMTHELLYSCDAALHEVYLDKKLMRQIISNLVSNAIKYSPDGKIIAVSLVHTGNALVLRVRDEGIGIPEADLAHLFEPFHRAANVGTISGTGLGLTIIKESVELHGGTLSVASQVGIGTTFTVNIPLTSEGAQANDQNPGD